MNKQEKSKVIGILIIIFCILGAILILYFLFTSSRMPSLTNQTPAQTTPATKSGKSLLFLDTKTNNIELYNLDGKKIKEFYRFENFTGKIVDARYFSEIASLAAIKEYKSGEQTKTDLVLIDIVSKKERLIDSYSFKEEQEGVGFGGSLYPERISTIKSLSPDKNILSYSITGWEYCNDVYYFLDISKKIYADWCDTTRWSPSGDKIVHFSTPGFATGPSFGFVNKSELIKLAKSNKEHPEIVFPEVDWANVQGDISGLLYNTPEMKSKSINERFLGVDQAYFIDDQNLLIESWSGTDPENKSYYFTFDIQKNQIKNINFSESGDIPWNAQAGEYFIKDKKLLLEIPENTPRIYSANIDNKTLDQMNMSEKPFEEKGKDIAYYPQIIDNSGNIVILNIIKNNKDIAENQYYWLDLDAKTTSQILKGENYIFSGWGNN